MDRKAYVICGSPGAGKTQYGAQLASVKSAAFIDIDISTDRLVTTGLTLCGKNSSDRDSMFFKESFRSPIYETLFDVAKANLQHLDVVIVGPFTKEIRNPEWPEVLRTRLGALVEIHYVYCAPEVRKKRLMNRASSRDAAKLVDWDKSTAYYGDEARPSFAHIFIDTTS